MIAGDFYRPVDPELRALAQASEKQEAFNQEVDPPKRGGYHQRVVWFNRWKPYLNRQVL